TALLPAGVATALVRLLSADGEEVVWEGLRALAATRLIARRGHVLLWEEAWVGVRRLAGHAASAVRREATRLLGQAPTDPKRAEALSRLLAVLADEEAEPGAAAAALAGLGPAAATAATRAAL